MTETEIVRKLLQIVVDDENSNTEITRRMRRLKNKRFRVAKSYYSGLKAGKSQAIWKIGLLIKEIQK